MHDKKKASSPDKALFSPSESDKDAVPEDYAPIEGPAEESAERLPPMPVLRMATSSSEGEGVRRSKRGSSAKQPHLDPVQGMQDFNFLQRASGL